MAIQILQGFNVTSASPIDTRFVLTKAQMKNMDDNLMPTKYFAICSEDNQIYYYDKLKVANSETGKFAPISTLKDQIIRGYYFNNKFYADPSYTIECPKDVKYIYIDNNSRGSLYTWDGTGFVKSSGGFQVNVDDDDRTLIFTNGNNSVDQLLDFLFKTTSEGKESKLIASRISKEIKESKQDIVKRPVKITKTGQDKLYIAKKKIN